MGEDLSGEGFVHPRGLRQRRDMMRSFLKNKLQRQVAPVAVTQQEIRLDSNGSHRNRGKDSVRGAQ